MHQSCRRAFKEWRVICDALMEGRQTLLLRKGGIKEDGVFTITNNAFFLMPTYEHQNPAMLQDGYKTASGLTLPPPGDLMRLSVYARADVILTLKDEAPILSMPQEYIWNSDYIQQRFEYNPYDPLYALILRVYTLPDPIDIPMKAEYSGCKSWVTLESPISTVGLQPVLTDTEFDERRQAILSTLT